MTSATATDADHRLFERFGARFPVKFKDSRSDYGTDVFLRDASASGVRITTNERFCMDDHVALEVELPDGQQPMVLNGRVVWTRFVNSSLWDVGLQFPQVSFMRMHRLFKFALESTS